MRTGAREATAHDVRQMGPEGMLRGLAGAGQEHAPMREGGDSAAGVHQCVEDGWVRGKGVKGWIT